MHRYPSDVREKIFAAYQELLVELEDVKKLSLEAESQYTKAAISRIKSSLTQPDDVSARRKVIEDAFQRQKKLEQPIRLLKMQIDKFTLYQKCKEKLSELDTLIFNSVETENYEMAATLKKHRDDVYKDHVYRDQVYEEAIKKIT